MIKVLLVACHFPPLGGGGAQRPTKFVRYLPDFGVRPAVVAGPTQVNSRWTPKDPHLAAEVSDEVPVYRSTEQPELSWSRLSRLLGRPTGLDAWWSRTLRTPAETAIADYRPDVLFVTLSPYSALKTVLELGERHGLPVVADLRDPWALDEVAVYPSRWHRARAIGQMGQQLARCQQVILNTPEALRAVRAAFPKLDARRLSVITNGYDSSDFEGLATRPRDGRFRVVHTGLFHTNFGLQYARRGRLRRSLGGELCEIDFLGRTHYYLLEALRELKANGADLASLDLHLLGVLTPLDRGLLEGSPLQAGQVRVTGYADHGTTVRAQVEADLLFLPMHALPKGQRARIVPGKTYEYLASGRPILAAVPEGDARDFVVAADGGEVVQPNDVYGMARSLQRALDRGPVQSRELSDVVTRFERRCLTEQLARVLERACI